MLGAALVPLPHQLLLALQVSVTAREDVPSFGPPLPSPPVFQKVRNGSESVYQVRRNIRVCVQDASEHALLGGNVICGVYTHYW